MVEPALIGTMVAGVLILVGLFAVLSRSRYSVPVGANSNPLGSSRGTDDPNAPDDTFGDTLDRVARGFDTLPGRIVAFLIGAVAVGALLGVAAVLGLSVYPLDLEAGGASLAVPVILGGLLLVSMVKLYVARDGVVAWSLAFLYLTLGLAGVVVLLVSGPAPQSNVWLVLSALVAFVGLLYGTYAMGRSIGDGNAGAVFVTATVLFVLAVAGITARLFLSG